MVRFVELDTEPWLQNTDTTLPPLVNESSIPVPTGRGGVFPKESQMLTEIVLFCPWVIKQFTSGDKSVV